MPEHEVMVSYSAVMQLVKSAFQSLSTKIDATPRVERVTEEETVSIGDRFIRDEDEEAMLASAGCNRVIMVSLRDGCKWGDGAVVKEVCCITPAELVIICGRYPESFKRKEE